jgi:hypothetical protein
MHPLVPAVLLRMARANAFDLNPEAEPPDGELTQAIERAAGAGLRNLDNRPAEDWKAGGVENTLENKGFWDGALLSVDRTARGGGWVFCSYYRAMWMTQNSRSALGRARFFLEKAKECSADERVEFEAFLEASIVFARAALHRLPKKRLKQPAWNVWWHSLLGNAAVEFFRVERDFILKEASPKIGQKIFAPSISPRTNTSAYTPSKALEFYYFESPDVEATETVERHLSELACLLADAEGRFSR